jgi:carboxyl-terminal processing protease
VRKHKALILDLRGNAGGAVETLLRMIGNLFDHDITVGDRKRRKDSKPLIAKSLGDHAYKGQLILLVDSGSASASEVLARVVQLEKRGTVLGDRTSGAVMESLGLGHKMGLDTIIMYGVSVTDADLIMADGKSLEHVGVVPDKVLLPTAAELRSQQDPILSYAASLVGVKLDAEKAGTFFPFKWRQ